MEGVKGQSGASVTAILAWLVFSVVLFLSFTKLMPLYYENLDVENIINSVAQRNDRKDATVADVKEKLLRGFQVNIIPDEIENSLEVRREGNEIIIDVNYERRVHMIYNIDAVLTFRSNRKIRQ